MSREEFVKLVPSSHIQSQQDVSSDASSVDSSAVRSNDTHSINLFDRKVLEAIYDDVVSSEFRILLNDTDLVNMKQGEYVAIYIVT